MLIQMKETRRGSEDGFRTQEYTEGNVYDVADGLARDFLAKGWAIEFSGSLPEALEALSEAERKKALESEETVYAAPYYAAAAAYAHAATMALRSEQKQGEK